MRPVRYTIVVRGRLSQRFASAFPGIAAEAGHDETRIDTEPLDLSQFYGLLEHLRNLAIELVSVNESSRTTEDAVRPTESDVHEAETS
jgi:hypothetical protein